jgi:hypothetical protein
MEDSESGRLMEPDKLRHIWIEIANGRGAHGGFLKSFATAFSYADPMNIEVITPAAIELVRKYGLEKYLDNFPSTDGFPPDPEPDPNRRAA